MEYTIGNKRSPRIIVKELVRHRRLLVTFAWRDLKLKYRQTIIGFAWVVLQPLIMMSIFTIVFASRIGTSSGDIPYPVFVFSGLIIYNVFAGGVSAGSNSLVIHADIIKKTYFPRIILPTSSVIATFMDYMASLLILFTLVLFFGPEMHFFHFLIHSLAAYFLVVLPTLGFALLFSTLNVRYRDVNMIFPFFLQIMLFISPIIYPLDTVKHPVFRTILLFNPLSGAIEQQKLAVFPGYAPNMQAVVTSVVLSVIMLAGSLFVFNKLEKNFADII